jgi:electron transfer flavoprotein alpha subunit
MPALVIAELENNALTKASRAAIAAAMQMSDAVDVWVSGHEQAATSVTETVGVGKVLWAQTDALFLMAETAAPRIAEQAGIYTHIVLPATTTGKDLAPRLAALLDVQQISEITAVHGADTFTRPIYAGNAMETVQSLQARHIITIRPTNFDAVATQGGRAEIVVLAPLVESTLTQLVHMELSRNERPELTAASIVISGGRGVGSKENFALIEALADTLGAAVGASRAAVDAGYVPNDYQVGQTGKVVAPTLYVAVGISGAIQHLAGMKESKVIVAINKDENAPIFEVADYGLVGDLFQILPELTAKLQQ